MDKMSNSLSREIALNENTFVIKYQHDLVSYLVRAYPFAVYEIEDQLADELCSGACAVESILPQQPEKRSTFTTPGIFYQPIMIMTNRCNLQCRYCYADSGSYGFSDYTDMEFPTIERTVRYVQDNILKHGEALQGQDIELAYVAFGGESLMNLPGVMHLLACAKESCAEMCLRTQANIHPLVIINTNGLLITEQLLEELEPDREYIEFVVSLDGIYHDENRIDRGGNGSLERTIRGIQLLKDRQFDFYVTCCLIPEYLDRTAENIRFIRSIIGPGKQINLSFIRGAIENVKDCVSYPGIVRQNYTAENVQKYVDDIVQLIENDENIYCNKFLRRAQAGGFRNKCAACLFEFCVIPDGTVYPCHNFVQAGYELGSIKEDELDIPGTELYQKFLSRDMDTLSPCQDCCLKSVCISSFDCPAHSEHDLQEFTQVDPLICTAGKQIQLALLRKLLKNGGTL